jgi:hypothetical protein
LPLGCVVSRAANPWLRFFAHCVVTRHACIADEFGDGFAAGATDRFQSTVDLNLKFVVTLDRQRAMKAGAH